MRGKQKEREGCVSTFERKREERQGREKESCEGKREERQGRDKENLIFFFFFWGGGERERIKTGEREREL